MASKEHGLSGKRKTKGTDENGRNVRRCDRQSTKKTVSQRIRQMFNNSDMSDISFTCGGSDKIFYAHKFVLGTSSAVFKAMFYGDLAETNSTINLGDTDEKSLEEFLKFLYTNKCNWGSLTVEDVGFVMYLSKKYIVSSLTEECVQFLKGEMEPRNVLYILEQAIHFDEKHLEMKSWKFIDQNAQQIVILDCFSSISHKILACLLKRDGLKISEVKLFKAVLKWIDYQCSQKGLDPTRENRRSVIGDAIYDLRFLDMREDTFAKNVATSGLLTAEETVSIYNKFNGIESPGPKWKVSLSGSRGSAEAASIILRKLTEDMKRTN